MLRKIAPHDVPRLSNHTRVARRRMLKLQRMTPAERERHQSLHLQATARSASTQNQTLSAILFLYREVLKVDAFSFDLTVRARRPERLPVVPTKQEVRAILDLMTGTPRLVANLLYGAGLRLLECLTLRVKDVDFGRAVAAASAALPTTCEGAV